MGTLKDLGTTVAKFAPLLGAAVGGPGGMAIGGLVANLFGVDPQNTDDLINKITLDPESAIKLKTLEDNTKIQLQQLVTSQAIAETQAQVADMTSARQMNAAGQTSGTKWVDEAIKLYIVIFLSVCIFGGLFYIKTTDVSIAEAGILSNIIGSALTVLITVAGFYFGGVVGQQKAIAELAKSTAQANNP